jgi:hypothetical protein
MNIPCPTALKQCAPCLDDPSANLSAEAPDHQVWVGPRIRIIPPPLGRIFAQPACLGICWSEFSQEDAEACALLAAELCITTTIVPVPPPVVYIRPPPLPVVSVFATDNRTEFGDDPGIFTISRTGNTDQPLTVPFVLSNTAIMGIDYDTVPETVTIPAGQSSVTIQIVPINTGEIVDKLVVLTITSSPTYNKGPAAVVIIGPPPVVTLDITQSLTEYGEAPASIVISRTGDTTYALSLPFTWGGDGVEGVDFIMTPSPIVIPAGQSSVTVYITAIHNHDSSTHNPELDFTASPDYSFDGGVDYAEVTINRSDMLDFVWTEPATVVGSCQTFSQHYQTRSFDIALSTLADPSSGCPGFTGGWSRVGTFTYSKPATNCLFHWVHSEFGAGAAVTCVIKVNGVTVMTADTSIPSGTDIPFTLPAGSARHASMTVTVDNFPVGPWPAGASGSGTWSLV